MVFHCHRTAVTTMSWPYKIGCSFILEMRINRALNSEQVFPLSPNLLIIILAGALACSNGDTWASELGTVVGRAEPFLITSRARVPKGKQM